MTPDAAQAVALGALAHLVADETARGRFLALSGATPEMLRQGTGDPAFLAGILDFLLGDEALLSAFCESAGLAPEAPAQARAALPGADPPW